MFLCVQVCVCGQTCFLIRRRHHAAASQWQVPKLCTDHNVTLFYIFILATYGKFADDYNASARRLLPAAMLERWQQVCRTKITFGLLLTNWFVSAKTNSIKCSINWIPLRIHVRSKNTQPCLKETPMKGKETCKNDLKGDL